MRYADYLNELLRPLGIYAEGGIAAAELESIGKGLDFDSDRLARVERESLLGTAEAEGLALREALFARKSAAVTVDDRRAAIGALLRVDGDCFTPSAINETLRGCGIRAIAEETAQAGHIRIVFPDVAGEPAEFAQIEKIVLDIIPCHLETEFYFRYLTWEECEKRGYTWELLEAQKHTWDSFSMAV